MSEQNHPYAVIGDGCFRDTSTLHKNAEGQWCFLEFTPVLNPDKKVVPKDAPQIVSECGLSGGGWQLPTVKQEVQLRNYASCEPATDVPDSPKSGYVITRDKDVDPSFSGCVWAVSLYDGDVHGISPNNNGFVRGCRLAPAGQDDLALGR